MGLSNYVPNSRIAQPGVCTSTTRPATPYEGQVIYETDTNRVLVWDASAWVMIADTDQPPGMQLIKTQTIGTAVSSVTVSDVFSSEFDNYRITVQGLVGSALGNMEMQLSGITSNSYLIGGTFFNYASATVNGYGPAATNKWLAAGVLGTTNSHTVIDLMAPFATTTKSFFTQSSSTAAYYSLAGTCTATTSVTGFVLTPNVASMTGGTIRVYGYRN